MPKTDYYQKLQAKFKYICNEQNREYLYSVVITKTIRKSNMQRNTRNNYRCHITPVYKSLNILKLHDIEN